MVCEERVFEKSWRIELKNCDTLTCTDTQLLYRTQHGVALHPARSLVGLLSDQPSLLELS